MSRRERDLSSLRTQSIPRRERIKRLVTEMQAHVHSNNPLNLSRPTHIETTEALHQMVYMSHPPGRLLVEYTDGTRGRPFPIAVLWKPEQGLEFNPNPIRHLQIGTLSLRHVDYDPHVDVYLIRDKETRQLTQAAIEELAYERMAEMLAAPQLREEFYLTIFQAGLESLAIGLYHALTDHLIERNQHGWQALRVRPVFGFRPNGDPDQGSIWGTGVL